MKRLGLILWQLPQYLLAKILLVIYRPTRYVDDYDRVWWYCSRFPGAISLGSVIIKGFGKGWECLIRHEKGHSIQSLHWGPLYLLVIGLPSILSASFGIRWPYGWPEEQADRLGGNV